MKVGIVGFSGAGKSTLFRAVSGREPTPPAGNPLVHTDLAVVPVPDERLAWLREVYRPKKYTPATVEFVDFAGVPVREEKGRAELFAKMRETDALVAVASAFEGAQDAVEVPGDPVERLGRLAEEFLLADLEVVERRVERLQEALSKGKSRDRARDERELDLLVRCRERLEAGEDLLDVARGPDERRLLQTYRFLRRKAVVWVINAGEGADRASLEESLARLKGVGLVLSGEVEAEIAQMEPDERRVFLAEYGLEEPASVRLIRAAFEATDALSFFTVGSDEVKAWVVRRGDRALDAARCIHSDIARGFIRAEVTPFEDVRAAGSLEKAKAAGKMRLEGKDYEVRDGDVIHFRFAV